MFRRPDILKPNHARPMPVRRATPQRALAGLGELGDVGNASTLVPELVTMIQNGIVNKASIINLGPQIQNALYTAKNTFQKGIVDQLPLGQANWEAWEAKARPATSDDNIWWTFGQQTATWADRLIVALNANPALYQDATVTKVSYTLMDTSQSGTTWYGGTVVSSKLNNQQWSTVFTKAFNVVCKGIEGGVLPVSMLTVVCKAMLATPTLRKFPVFNPPEGSGTDPKAIAWRSMMKQLGWNDVVDLWFAYTQQAWAAQNAAADQLDAAYGRAITALKLVSGVAVLDQIREKVSAMAQERSRAVQSIQGVSSLLEGPLASYVPAEKVKQFSEIKAQFAEADSKTNDVLGAVGMWPPQAVLNGLGAVPTLIIAGTIGVSILGMCVWLLSLWTSVARAASDQAKEISDSVLDIVGEVKASCIREYEASAKTPADEAKMQECLLKTKELVASIPAMPSSPVGAGTLAILGAVGLGALYLLKHKP